MLVLALKPALDLPRRDGLRLVTGQRTGRLSSAIDSAGVALQVGSIVSHIKVGDRVAGMVYGCGSEDNGGAAKGASLSAGRRWSLFDATYLASP
jgi:NADPH:quinone reductase-like Zn-dependent oxidoreductase